MQHLQDAGSFPGRPDGAIAASDFRDGALARQELADALLGAPGQNVVTTGAHIAFEAADRAEVAEFHAAALRHGGRDIGAPGPRSEYSERYYGAFAPDPDDNNIEAVCHAPEGESAATA